MKHSKSEDEFFSLAELASETRLKIYKLATQQFLYQYCANLDKSGDPCLWGNELESILLKKNHKNIYTLSINHCYEDLAKFSDKLTLMPEFARFILEFIPNTPFDEKLGGVHLKCNEYIKNVTRLFDTAELEGFTILLGTCYPLFGQDFLINADRFSSQTSNQLEQLKSKMLEYVSNNGRYRTLVSNLLLRRGSVPWTNVFSSSGDKYYLPGPLFGMGLCGMHVTIQSANMEGSRFLYDALQPLCPFFLALSASTSVMGGILLGSDTRMRYLSEAMEDRPLHECSGTCLTRYGVTGVYIANHPANIPLLNDLEYCPPERDNIPDLLQAIGNDVKIPSYVQSILSHFPLVISKDVLASRNGDTDSNCWEQAHSLVWPSCRWKLPPLNSPKGGLGWRTEIRCMEMQFSVAENVAYALFAVLLSRAIRDMGLLFYIPQSFILQDMSLAEKCNAIINEKFWVRDIFFDLHVEETLAIHFQTSSSSKQCRQLVVDAFSSETKLALENRRRFAKLRSLGDDANLDTRCPKDICTCSENNSSDFHLIRLAGKELMCGSARYPGLLPVLTMYVNAYFKSGADNMSADDVDYIHSVLSYLADRAAGTIPTCATAVRNLVQDIYTHRINSPTESRTDELSEIEAQVVVNYMLGARQLSLDSLREYYSSSYQGQHP